MLFKLQAKFAYVVLITTLIVVMGLSIVSSFSVISMVSSDDTNSEVVWWPCEAMAGTCSGEEG